MKMRKSVDGQYVDELIKDLVSKLLYLDRKDDKALPPGAIEGAVKGHQISISFMVQSFYNHLSRAILGIKAP